MIFNIHKHKFKLVAKTYAKSLAEKALDNPGLQVNATNPYPADSHGQTTILWECTNPNCNKTRVHTMLGKEVV